MIQQSILVVDDEPDFCALLKRTLGPDLRCRVETASSGKEALRLLAADRFDVVLADIRMPEMDGLKLLEAIRQIHPGQIVILMTGHGWSDAVAEATEQEDCDILPKPFDHDTLIRRLRQALERSART